MTMTVLHGCSGTKEYRCWVRMNHRCHNPDYEGYEDYGARGIRVCDRWRRSFQAFLDDVGKAPSPKHSIERKDNDGPYSPTNCVWATRAEQACNRRDTVRWAFGGLLMTMAQWARFLGVPRQNLHKKKVRGLTPAQIIAPLWPAEGGREAA